MGTNQVSKAEFKAKALEYFRQVEASGESVIVTDHGKPVLEVRPYYNAERGPLDLLCGSVVRYENPTDPVGEDEWEAARQAALAG
jgi:antitoxin (DNA-binding transcriptional repressor) of toxin-antitoxin stability system